MYVYHQSACNLAKKEICKLSYSFFPSIFLLSAEIVIAPETQHHLLNDNERATFFCQAVGDTAHWLINGNTIDGLGNDDLKGNGWIFNETFVADPHNQRNNVFNLTLEIPPAIGNNNTQIRCVATQHSLAFSDPVLLIIKGTCTYTL